MKLHSIAVGLATISLSLVLMPGQAQSASYAEDGYGEATTNGDLVFDSDFDGPTNGGTTCETAIDLDGGRTYSAETDTTPNWMNPFGPLLSTSHDVVYTFVAGSDLSGSITPTVSNYSFAMYLIPSCNDLGAEPSPIGATATIGRGINLEDSGVVSGNTYYLAITGAPAAGPTANGFVNFTTPRGMSRR